MKLPHEVERLGPDVQSWVEQQLLSDLRHYGVQLTTFALIGRKWCKRATGRTFAAG